MKKKFDCVAFQRKRRNALAKKFSAATPQEVVAFYSSRYPAEPKKAA